MSPRGSQGVAFEGASNITPKSSPLASPVGSPAAKQRWRSLSLQRRRTASSLEDYRVRKRYMLQRLVSLLFGARQRNLAGAMLLWRAGARRRDKVEKAMLTWRAAAWRAAATARPSSPPAAKERAQRGLVLGAEALEDLQRRTSRIHQVEVSPALATAPERRPRAQTDEARALQMERRPRAQTDEAQSAPNGLRFRLANRRTPPKRRRSSRRHHLSLSVSPPATEVLSASAADLLVSTSAAGASSSESPIAPRRELRTASPSPVATHSRVASPERNL